MQRFDRHTRSTSRTLVVLACLIAMSASVTGCQRSLFTSREPRTQFEAHQRMRNEYIPLKQPDVFGNPQPALRARLGRRN